MNWNDPNRKTPQEVTDQRDEREAEEYAEMYATVTTERQNAGLPNSPIQACAETMRRLKEKYDV